MHHSFQSNVLPRAASLGLRDDAVSKCPRGCAWLLCALLACHASSTLAAVTIQDPGTFVVDRAGLISADVERRLEGYLRELEQKTTAQVKVLTVKSLDGEDVFGFAQRHAELWKLGRKGKDNGVLIVVVPKTRAQKGHIRIQTGYGEEGAVPDSWSGSLSRETVSRYLKRNQYSEGIFFATVAVANKIADEANVKLSGIPAHRFDGSRGRRRGKAVCAGGFVPFIVLMMIMSSLGRRRRHYGRWGGGGMMQGLMFGAIMGNMLGGRVAEHGIASCAVFCRS